MKFLLIILEAQQSTVQNVYESTDSKIEKVLNIIHPIVMYFVIPFFLSIPVMISIFKIVSSPGEISDDSFLQVYTAS